MIINWRKASYSGNSGGACVEVGGEPDVVGIRDSKNRVGGHLVVRPTTWAGFIAGITTDQLDPRR